MTNRVDVHPEDLLDAAYRGELDDASRQRLNAHIAQCASCRLEHSLIDDLAEETAASVDDDVRLDAAVALVMGSTSVSVPPSAPRVAAGLSRRAVWLAGGLVIGAFGGAAAAFWAMAPTEGATEAPAPAVHEPIEDVVEPRTGADRRAVEPDPTVVEVPSQATVEPDPFVDSVAPRPLTAAELLTLGNEARREGSSRLAARRYRELQSAHPTSREAVLSYVSLGRLLLDSLGDARGALAQFDRYLANPGPLAEEARVGRAVALGRLGRGADERRAWQDVLDHHPSSPHADRARAHLAP